MSEPYVFGWLSQPDRVPQIVFDFIHRARIVEGRVLLSEGCASQEMGPPVLLAAQIRPRGVRFFTKTCR